MILNVFETLTKWSEDLKDWIITNGSNPYFWIGLFFLGLLIFFITYNALNKNK